MRYALFALGATVIFTVFVAVFAASAEAAKVRLLPKWVWVVLSVVAAPIGGILYLWLGRPIGGADGTPASAGGSGVSDRTNTVAPDDDPEFLRNLAQRLREQGKDDSGNQ
jgi:hypothetical protein